MKDHPSIGFSFYRDRIAPMAGGLSVQVDKIHHSILTGLSIDDIVREIAEAITRMAKLDATSESVLLWADGKYELQLEKSGDDGAFCVIGRAKSVLDPTDGKTRIIVAERLPFPKLELRMRKGIERYRLDPNPK